MQEKVSVLSLVLPTSLRSYSSALLDRTDLRKPLAEVTSRDRFFICANEYGRNGPGCRFRRFPTGPSFCDIIAEWIERPRGRSKTFPRPNRDIGPPLLRTI